MNVSRHQCTGCWLVRLGRPIKHEPYRMRHSKKERYYSIEHCAEMLDLSQEFFRKRIRLHQITYAKIGKSVRIPESALYDLVEVRKSAHDLVKEKA